MGKTVRISIYWTEDGAKYLHFLLTSRATYRKLVLLSRGMKMILQEYREQQNSPRRRRSRRPLIREVMLGFLRWA